MGLPYEWRERAETRRSHGCQEMAMDAPVDVAAIMDRVGAWWAIAGGWAIDLWLGEKTRDHHDVEVVVRRCDQRLVHDALSADWELSSRASLRTPPRG